MKVLHSQNSKHSSHEGAVVSRSTIRHSEEIRGFHGPEEVIFHYQDDKAKVPIGLIPANKQVPLVMYVEYEFNLPGHNFAIAKQHKLVKLVIGNMQVTAKTFSVDAVMYSGPTYIGI